MFVPVAVDFTIAPFRPRTPYRRIRSRTGRCCSSSPCISSPSNTPDRRTPSHDRYLCLRDLSPPVLYASSSYDPTSSAFTIETPGVSAASTLPGCSTACGATTPVSVGACFAREDVLENGGEY